MSVLLGAATTCYLSGLFPWINAELIVVGSALLVPRELLIPFIVATTIGRILGKLTLYAVARWAPQRLPKRARALIERATVLVRAQKTMALAIFSSAAVSIPPLYLMTIACGAVGVSVRLFAGMGFLGTLARIAALTYASVFLGSGLG